MMKTKRFNPNDLRVASPCPAGWDTMKGDDRSRLCSLCELQVYNIAGMSTDEIESLIGGGGRVCIRLFRRADGTVIKKDCPVGVRSLRKRTARMISAAAAAILGLFSVTYGQKDDGKSSPAPVQQVNDTTRKTQEVLSGTITDLAGALVPGVEILIFKENNKKPFRILTSNDEGVFKLSGLPDGRYRLQFTVGGFKKHIVENVEIRNPNRTELKVELQPADTTVVVGLYGQPSLIEIDGSEVKTVFRADPRTGELRKEP